MKTRGKINEIFLTIVMIVMAVVAAIQGCKRDTFVDRSSTKSMIADYMRVNAQDYSMFTTILDTTKFGAFLSAYGIYTCFVPNNTAIQTYLTSKGKNTLKDLTMDEMITIVKFHVFRDTMSSSSFTDGKLANPNMYGQYIAAQTVISGGLAKIQVNKQALILQADIRLENGILHMIDHVMEPSVKEIMTILDADPNYSFFAQAMHETGCDALIAAPRLSNGAIDTAAAHMVYYTVIAETDAVIKDAGFSSYAALKARYCNTGNPTDQSDSLNIFVRYHVVPGFYFLADMFNQSSLNTLPSPATVSNPNPVADAITTKVGLGGIMLINDDDIGGVHYSGVAMDKINSNISAVNGVVNLVTANYTARKLISAAVYWNVCAQPELTSNKAIYHQPKGAVLFQNIAQRITDATNQKKYFQLTNIRINIPYAGDISTNGGGGVQGWYCGYACAPQTVQSAALFNAPLPKGVVPYDDVLIFQLRGTLSGNNNAYPTTAELTTPVIVKGKYKVWICLAFAADDRSTKGGTFAAYIDGYDNAHLLSNTFTQMTLTDTSVKTDASLAQLGLKRYMWHDFPYAGTKAANSYAGCDSDMYITTDAAKLKVWGYMGQYLGIVDFQTTASHNIILDRAPGMPVSSNPMLIKMFHFIPADFDDAHQYWPKFDRRGNLRDQNGNIVGKLNN
jgi:uncharacterized surface protein with fasciclin (FAS1) repeats